MSGGVEILSKFKPHPEATEILFDLDGTISLVRAGWSELMLASFLRQMPRLDGDPHIKAFIHFRLRLVLVVNARFPDAKAVLLFLRQHSI